MKKEEFIQAFQQQYGGYICVSNEIVGEFYDTLYQGFQKKGFNDKFILDLCKDFVISQGLVEEIVK